MIKAFVHAETRGEKALRNILSWAAASGKYKRDNQKACDIPAEHLSVNWTFRVETLCTSNNFPPELAEVA